MHVGICVPGCTGSCPLDHKMVGGFLYNLSDCQAGDGGEDGGGVMARRDFPNPRRQLVHNMNLKTVLKDNCGMQSGKCQHFFSGSL